MSKQALWDLRDVFSSVKPLTEYSSASVMLRASPFAVEAAQAVANEMPLDLVMKQLAGILAEQYANELYTKGVKPSDFAEMEEIPTVLAERLGALLGEAPDLFVWEFMNQMRTKG